MVVGHEVINAGAFPKIELVKIRGRDFLDGAFSGAMRIKRAIEFPDVPGSSFELLAPVIVSNPALGLFDASGCLPRVGRLLGHRTNGACVHRGSLEDTRDAISAPAIHAPPVSRLIRRNFVHRIY